MHKMEPESRAMDEMLETARKAGGEQLVRQIKRAREIEFEVSEKLGEIYQQTMDIFEREDILPTVAAGSMANIFSNAYAVAIALVGKAAGVGEDKRAGLISTSIRSLMKHLEAKFDEIEAHDNGVADNIMASASKFGPLPKGDE
jgi:uncharacterized 2Fe-2S/4Fe-4S cluster protein (DUF4445 family)